MGDVRRGSVPLEFGAVEAAFVRVSTCLFGDPAILQLPSWFIVVGQLKVLQKKRPRLHKLALVAENSFLEIGTKWLFKQVAQELFRDHVVVIYVCTNGVVDGVGWQSWTHKASTTSAGA